MFEPHFCWNCFKEGRLCVHTAGFRNLTRSEIREQGDKRFGGRVFQRGKQIGGHSSQKQNRLFRTDRIKEEENSIEGNTQ